MADDVGRGLKAMRDWINPGQQGDLKPVPVKPSANPPNPVTTLPITKPPKPATTLPGTPDYKGYSYSGYAKAGGTSKYDDWKKEVDKFSP